VTGTGLNPTVIGLVDILQESGIFQSRPPDVVASE
jgi:hypothetical protein